MQNCRPAVKKPEAGAKSENETAGLGPGDEDMAPRREGGWNESVAISSIVS